MVSRYDHHIANARTQLVDRVQHFAAIVLTETRHASSIKEGSPTLPGLLSRLRGYAQKIAEAVQMHPLSMAVDPESGQPIPHGDTIGRLVAELHYVVVKYSNLDQVPAALVAQIRSDFTDLQLSARVVMGLSRDA